MWVVVEPTSGNVAPFLDEFDLHSERVTFALLGLVPPWAGVVYAVGFVLPELASQLILPRRTDPSGKTDPEPLWVMSVLLSIRPRIHRVGVAVLGAAAIWSVVVPLFGGG